jgi:hypothetical protein
MCHIAAPSSKLYYFINNEEKESRTLYTEAEDINTRN